MDVYKNQIHPKFLKYVDKSKSRSVCIYNDCRGLRNTLGIYMDKRMGPICRLLKQIKITDHLVSGYPTD